ncbi:Rve domain containing hypothetical protein [Phytophthora palmivora]|uniref:Uncharacterized protein n=1 Tax=Phytophthora palmivora TaxID=4796 RepID=A0A2P4XW17_9STRA|nr:Rve domain containing hypothetical protein [Phytophthora palmivora]
MKNQSQLYECYKYFRKKPLNIFRRDIKILEWYPCSIKENDIPVLQADIRETWACNLQKNEVAERRMRTIMERVRALRLDGKFTKQLWADCVCHVTTLISITPKSKTDGRTPYELWYNRIPSVPYMKEYRDKPDARARLCFSKAHPTTKAEMGSKDEYPSLTNLTDTPEQPTIESDQHVQKELNGPIHAMTSPTVTHRLPPLRDTNPLLVPDGDDS